VTRLFAAVMVPVEVTAHLDEHLDGIRTARPDLRWQPAAKWHLTLEFLGECGPREVDRQIERWHRRAARSGPMTLHLAGAGTFGKTFIARVLWVGLGGDVSAWQRLAAYDQQPHVTIARTRERTDLTGVVLELERYEGPSWTADSMALVESRQHGARGSQYVPLEWFALGGGESAGSSVD
jgi:2'-5' RNA ligase